ncbi:MAG: methylmalonyl-CoA epimerase [Gemmatimonadetes bacterium]|nr:methylmalonyl-CoA epimerase [Gemmatimonadota bacterium]
MELALDHVAIATSAIRELLPLYEFLTGAPGSSLTRNTEQGVDLVFLGSGPCRLELLQPTHPDSPVGRFLERRGPGLHHIAYRVPDLEAALRRLAEAGIRLIDRQPRRGAHDRRIAFVHPESTGGVLVELVEDDPAR